MKTLKNCIRLSCSVKIYVPSTINVNESFNNLIWVDNTLKFLAGEFGGSTASKALGAWVAMDGQLIKENVTTVLSYASQDQLEQGIQKVYDFCLDMKAKLGQESIALEVNNELYLI
jgi:hypothetical protein